MQVTPDRASRAQQRLPEIGLGFYIGFWTCMYVLRYSRIGWAAAHDDKGPARPTPHGRLVHDAGLVKLFAPLRSVPRYPWDVPSTRWHPYPQSNPGTETWDCDDTPFPRPQPPVAPSQKRGCLRGAP